MLHGGGVVSAPSSQQVMGFIPGSVCHFFLSSRLFREMYKWLHCRSSSCLHWLHPFMSDSEVLGSYMALYSIYLHILCSTVYCRSPEPGSSLLASGPFPAMFTSSRLPPSRRHRGLKHEHLVFLYA